MSDLTTELSVPKDSTQTRKRAEKTEFIAYFAIIFAATLPLACLTWALHAIRQRSLRVKGPMARAWSQARIITPMIFSA